MHTRMAEMLHAFVTEDAKDVLKYVNVDLLCMLMYFVCSFQITNASECSNVGLMSEQGSKKTFFMDKPPAFENLHALIFFRLQPCKFRVGQKLILTGPGRQAPQFLESCGTMLRVFELNMKNPAFAQQNNSSYRRKIALTEELTTT